MGTFKSVVALGATVLGFGFLPGAASAATVQYEAIDLADVVSGEDLWQYRYQVSGTFEAFGGFNVLFDPASYSQLEDPPPAVNADWALSVIQPDTGLPADGLYTATALNGTPDLTSPFILNVVWLGVASPGSQAFEVFNATFDIIETGVTSVSAVPLPTAGWLLVMALGGVRRRRG